MKVTGVPAGTGTVASKQLPAPFTSVMVHRVAATPGVVMATVPVGVPVPGATGVTDPTVNFRVWPDTGVPGPEKAAAWNPSTVVGALPTVSDREPVEAAYQVSPG